MKRRLSSAAVRHRFLALLGIRWMTTGLVVPVVVLLPLERGLELHQLGLAVAAQGLMVLALELPTGGLADALGRRRVLVAAGVFNAIALGVAVFADSVLWFALVFGLQGVYRALDSGPLDAWYVDTAQAADPDADIERSLSLGGLVTGLGIAVGTLASSGLVALDPVPGVEALVTPLFAALTLQAVQFVALASLMADDVSGRQAGGLREAVADVPGVVAGAVRMVRTGRLLTALVAVELLWGFGMAAFEMLTPAKLGAVLDSADRAAALLGPVNTGAWVAAAAGAALIPHMTRRLTPRITAAALRIAQGAAVVGLAVVTGPVGLVIAYVLTMGVHGAANPVHQGLLHRAVVDPSSRATVVSANSLTGQTGGMLGGIALGALADAAGLTTAILVGAGFLAAAAPLYLIRDRRPEIRSEGVSALAPEVPA
jgi:MFS family permease